jgi:hypothetical protein
MGTKRSPSTDAHAPRLTVNYHTPTWSRAVRQTRCGHAQPEPTRHDIIVVVPQRDGPNFDTNARCMRLVPVVRSSDNCMVM